jgi:DNA-binding GntR family transcriptional regulator
VDFNPRRGAYIRPLSLKSVADLFDVRIALSLLATRTMATAPVESYIDTLARRCAELDSMVDDGDPIAFARVTIRAVRTVAHGSGNELLAEQLADLANQTVWATIWKAPLDYQTREIRRETADLMHSTLDAIRRRDAVAAVTSQRKLLEDDRDRALASLSRIMAAAVDFGVFSRKDAGQSELLATSAA